VSLTDLSGRPNEISPKDLHINKARVKKFGFVAGTYVSQHSGGWVRQEDLEFEASTGYMATVTKKKINIF
jgi:hypothetical protein